MFDTAATSIPPPWRFAKPIPCLVIQALYWSYTISFARQSGLLDMCPLFSIASANYLPPVCNGATDTEESRINQWPSHCTCPTTISKYIQKTTPVHLLWVHLVSYFIRWYGSWNSLYNCLKSIETTGRIVRCIQHGCRNSSLFEAFNRAVWPQF